jgi:N-formylglutamate amidohydrolase
MSSRPSEAYKEAVDRAALMLLAALRDHTKLHFSSVQLEAMRLRGGLVENGQCRQQGSVHAVFADIRERATVMLAAELKKARVADDVGAEMNRVLRRLLDSVEDMFAEHG